MHPFSYLVSQVPRDSRVLDLGSGPGRYSEPFPNRIRIDAWPNVKPDIVMDLEVEDLTYDDNSFDEVLMIDFIEHISKERGEELLRQAIRIAEKRVWLLTPLWWDTNEKHTRNEDLWCFGNEFNLHKSLWTCEELDSLGFVNVGYGNYYWGYRKEH